MLTQFAPSAVLRLFDNENRDVDVMQTTLCLIYTKDADSLERQQLIYSTFNQPNKNCTTMLFNYKMTSAIVGQIQPGKANAGMYYVVASLKNAVNRRGKVTTITVFANDDPDFVSAVRSVLPATGNDPETGQPWHGTDATAPATGFDKLAAIKKLETLNGEDYTLFPGAKNFATPLPGKYVMTYATNLNGHTAGDPVLEKNSSFVKVVTEVNIFVMMYDEASEQYVEGWSPADRLRSRMNNLIPLEEFIKDPAKKAMVNPRDLGESVTVPLDSAERTADETF